MRTPGASKDVSLPGTMKRSMARQAEADRERRARVINADAELRASKKLAGAAHEMAKEPAALQLRLLRAVVAVAAEKDSTLVLALPRGAAPLPGARPAGPAAAPGFRYGRCGSRRDRPLRRSENRTGLVLTGWYRFPPRGVRNRNRHGAMEALTGTGAHGSYSVRVLK